MIRANSRYSLPVSACHLCRDRTPGVQRAVRVGWICGDYARGHGGHRCNHCTRGTPRQRSCATPARYPARRNCRQACNRSFPCVTLAPIGQTYYSLEPHHSGRGGRQSAISKTPRSIPQMLFVRVLGASLPCCNHPLTTCHVTRVS